MAMCEDQERSRESFISLKMKFVQSVSCLWATHDYVCTCIKFLNSFCVVYIICVFIINVKSQSLILCMAYSYTSRSLTPVYHNHDFRTANLSILTEFSAHKDYIFLTHSNKKIVLANLTCQSFNISKHNNKEIPASIKIDCIMVKNH